MILINGALAYFSYTFWKDNPDSNKTDPVTGEDYTTACWSSSDVMNETPNYEITRDGAPPTNPLMADNVTDAMETWFMLGFIV